MSYRYKLIISFFLFLYTLTIFLPGAYSIDSWNQWNEVTGKHFDDWYGTGLATSWRLLWILTGNYMCLYVTQMFLYWTFITLLIWKMRFRKFAYWLTLGAALFFCFIPQYVMRDSLTVLAWGIASLLLLYACEIEKYRRLLAILSLLLLAYGVWVRINAFIALLPLIYAAILLMEKEKQALWKRLLLTVGATLALLVGIQLFTYKIQKADKTFPDYKLKLLDLSGISMLSGENLFPPAINNYHLFNLDTLFSKYTPASIDDIYWPENHQSIFPYPNDSLDNAVTGSYRSAILHHPFLYLENRFNGFLYYLRIRKRFSSDEYWNVAAFTILPNNSLGLRMENTKLKTRIIAAYGHFYRTFIFDPWFWLLLNMGGLALFTRRYVKRPASESLYWLTHAIIQLSGILFTFSQLLIYQHDRDFRYNYWNVFVTFIALAGAFAAKRQGTGFKPAP